MNRIEAGRVPSAVREHLPAGRFLGAGHLLGVDGNDDALRAELLGPLAHERPPLHGRRVDRHLVGARLQKAANVFHRTHAAPYRERHEAAFSRPLHDVEDGFPVLVARRDVEEAEFVGTRRVIGAGRLDRIAGIDQVDKVDALDHAAIGDVETGDDADLQGHRQARFFRLFPTATLP